MERLIFYFVVRLIILNFFVANAFADQFKNTTYEVCFTPGEDCTNLIINYIKKSKTSILLQAYSFTSAPIANAILQAKKRGVDVKAILDKSQFKSSYSASKFLLNQEIPVWKDHRVSIAHNKVIIIDNKIVITGSFNFTKSAQERNAENIIIIEDSTLAERYISNWNKRMAFSDRIEAIAQ